MDQDGARLFRMDEKQRIRVGKKERSSLIQWSSIDAFHATVLTIFAMFAVSFAQRRM